MQHTLDDIQQQLQRLDIEGWLIYVWRDVNPTATAILDLPVGGHRSRRCFYFIPAEGEPRILHHAIEPHTLEHLPGSGDRYLSYTSLHEKLRKMLGGAKKIAMEYSPNALIPTVSWVDGGTVELVRSFGVEIVSSAELIQHFEAVLSDEQIASHLDAAVIIRDIAHEAFRLIGRRLDAGEEIREHQVQRFIMDQFAAKKLETDHGPIVARDAHASDPHYEPVAGQDAPIERDQVVLIDLWARYANNPTSIYADETWMGFTGQQIPEKVRNTWELVRDARRAGFDLVKERMAAGEPVYGWEVDDAVRHPIDRARLGQYFIHRTGHSITTVTHGNGANIDNLETKELRPIIPRTLFSIEPGVYQPEFGVRSEYDVLITPDGRPMVAEGCDQEDLIQV